MDSEFEKSRIEKLKRSLYSRNEKVVPKEHRTPVHSVESDVPTNWGERPNFQFSEKEIMQTNNSFFNKFFVTSIIFFVISLLIAGFIFFGGINMISSNNLDIKVIGSSSISSGEELDLGLSIVNQNRADLEAVSLTIIYPDGTRSVDASAKTLTRDKVDIGTIAQGQSKDHTVRVAVFGEKDAVKTFTFSVDYKLKGSNATFTKDKTYDVLIGSSPILLNVDYPKEVNSGKDVALSVSITSNSSSVVQNVLVKVEYPYGFTYTDSSMKPLRDNNVWSIGDLKNGDKKTFTISGNIVGQNLEDRTFRVSVGTQSSDPTKDFDVSLAASTITMGIRKSFFDLSADAQNGNVASIGLPNPITIKWQNTLPDKIVNSKIQAFISGDAFDKNSVNATGGGYYDSYSKSVSWDKTTVGDLTEISPGDSGQLQLSFASLADPMQMRSIKNPHMDVHIVMTGSRSGSVTEDVSSTADVTLKVESTIGLTAKSYREVGPFANTGPIPPRAEKESTYTVTWTLTDTSNDLKDGVVLATLPAGVVWKGETSPTSERISYNPDTRQVLWSVGTVTAGTGFTYSPRAVSFKVGITPNVKQVGSVVSLISETSVTATDTYTLTSLKARAPVVTTQYSDPNFKSNNDIVGK